MYHPTRGGVRGGRDQFKWDDVKVDKHRENYLGHSINAPVGRWQKGKDLFWYTREKSSGASQSDALKEEIRRVKEEEEQAMREALGLAPKRASKPKGSRLDKHEYAELVKRGSASEDLEGGHAEAAQVKGLGLYKVPRTQEESSPVPEANALVIQDTPSHMDEPPIAISDDASKKRHRDDRSEEKESKRERHEDRKERGRDKREKRHDSDDRRKSHHKDKKQRSRHDSD